MKRIVVAALIGVAACAHVASADEAGPVAVGDRVRLEATLATGERSFVGPVTAADSASLTLSLNGVASRIAKMDIVRLERSVQRSHKKKGALIGLGAGFLVGFAATAFLGNCDESGGTDGCVDGYSVLYGLGAASVGAAVGALIAPGERWETLPSPRTSLKLSPMLRGRRGLAVTLAFR